MIWLQCMAPITKLKTTTVCLFWMQKGHSSQIHQIHVKSKILELLKYSHWEWKVPQISAAEPKRFRFYGHFKGFPWWIWGQNVIWSILSVPLRVWKLKWKYCFWGSLNTTWLCFRKNEIWNLSLIQKRIVEVVKNEKIAFWH